MYVCVCVWQSSIPPNNNRTIYLQEKKNDDEEKEKYKNKQNQKKKKGVLRVAWDKSWSMFTYLKVIVNEDKWGSFPEEY